MAIIWLFGNASFAGAAEDAIVVLKKFCGKNEFIQASAKNDAGRAPRLLA